MAAAIAAVAANLLMDTRGRSQDFFAQIDVLRLPLGILSSIGFIGAGAIIKKDDIALGVTTAATMWFMTVIGLCFGLGFLWLGIAGSLCGLAVIWGLKWVDSRMPKAMRATLTVEADSQCLDERALQQMVRARYRPIIWSSEYRGGGRLRVEAVLQWRGRPQDAAGSPLILEELRDTAGILSVAWHPAALGN